MAQEEPQVGEDAVQKDASQAAEAGTSTDEAAVGEPADSTTADPHPDGISTEDVEARAGEPADSPGNTGAGVAADADAEVAPTGTANVAGTPQSQLSQAPPMTDPSGSNVPAPNLRQPLADGADPAAGAGTTTSDGLDAALVNPEETAVARVEGRTSDAANRSADGPHIDEVPADITDGPKPSDGGVERYPFPQGGDVDIATVSTDVQPGEYFPNLEIEDSVILLEHELVPDRLVGRRALVVDAPRYLVPMDKKDEVWITVKTRDEVNATLSLPLAAVEVRKGAVDVTVRG